MCASFFVCAILTSCFHFLFLFSSDAPDDHDHDHHPSPASTSARAKNHPPNRLIPKKVVSSSEDEDEDLFSSDAPDDHDPDHPLGPAPTSARTKNHPPKRRSQKKVVSSSEDEDEESVDDPPRPLKRQTKRKGTRGQILSNNLGAHFSTFDPSKDIRGSNLTEPVLTRLREKLTSVDANGGITSVDSDEPAFSPNNPPNFFKKLATTCKAVCSDAKDFVRSSTLWADPKLGFVVYHLVDNCLLNIKLSSGALNFEFHMMTCPFVIANILLPALELNCDGSGWYHNRIGNYYVMREVRLVGFLLRSVCNSNHVYIRFFNILL